MYLNLHNVVFGACVFKPPTPLTTCNGLNEFCCRFDVSSSSPDTSTHRINMDVHTPISQISPPPPQLQPSQYREGCKTPMSLLNTSRSWYVPVCQPPPQFQPPGSQGSLDLLTFEVIWVPCSVLHQDYRGPSWTPCSLPTEPSVL